MPCRRFSAFRGSLLGVLVDAERVARHPRQRPGYELTCRRAMLEPPTQQTSSYWPPYAATSTTPTGSSASSSAPSRYQVLRPATLTRCGHRRPAMPELQISELAALDVGHEVSASGDVLVMR